jgi:hypothetical protein
VTAIIPGICQQCDGYLPRNDFWQLPMQHRYFFIYVQTGNLKTNKVVRCVKCAGRHVTIKK